MINNLQKQLDSFDLDQQEKMEGQSLVPLVANKKLKWRDVLFLENLNTGRDEPFS